MLRPYQVDVINKTRLAIINGKRRPLIQAATGSGKTVIAGAIIDSAVNKGKTVLFTGHRKEIINQTSAKLDAIGIDHGVIMAGHPRWKPNLPVQVASIQTLSRRMMPPADLVFIDEAHLSCSKSFIKLVEHYKNSIIVGLTATPVRLDGKGLGMVYDHMEEAISMSELIDMGFLVKPRVFAPFTPDMTGVKTVAGDYDQHAVAELMDKTSITGDIVKHWKQHAQGRKTIVFAASVAHSEHIQAAFLQDGISARHLDATTKSWLRDKTLEDWRQGRFDVLCNCGLFIEGLDVVETGCVILARPTQSLTIYLQAVGRGMRPAPGKTDVIILDHAGLTHRHGLVDEPREWSLDGKKKSKRKTQGEEAAPTVTICESCFAAFSRQEFPDKCPQCGEPLPKRKQAVADVRGEGELVELTDEHMERIKARRKQELKAAKTIDQLIELGRARGYAHPEAWAKHRMQERQSWRRRAHG